MTTNDVITQMEEIYSGNPWYGDSFSKILNNIKPENAVKKIAPGGHTIVDILYHIIAWRYFTIRQLQGDKEYDVKQNDKSDWKVIDYHKKDLWKDALSDFEDTHKMIIEELHNFNNNKLDEKVPVRDYSYKYLISGLIQHDIYHLGQISLLSSTVSNI